MNEKEIAFNRIVKVPASQGEWIPIPFANLRNGQLFMLYESDGEPLGKFKATSEPYVNQDGVWTIKHE